MIHKHRRSIKRRLKSKVPLTPKQEEAIEKLIKEKLEEEGFKSDDYMKADAFDVEDYWHKQDLDPRDFYKRDEFDTDDFVECDSFCKLEDQVMDIEAEHTKLEATVVHLQDKMQEIMELKDSLAALLPLACLIERIQNQAREEITLAEIPAKLLNDIRNEARVALIKELQGGSK